MRKRIHNWLLRHLFNAVTADEALKYNKGAGKMWIGKKEISQPNITNLRSEAKAIKQFQLYKLITTQIEHLANEMMYHRNSKPWDLVHGQAILQSIDTIKLIIDEIANLEIEEPEQPKSQKPEKSGDNK